jgi:predicted permease
MTNLIGDLRYAVRTLRKRPGFTMAAVTVLALGIGANTAVFSLVNAFLLKPLLIKKPEQLVGCYSRDVTKPDTYRAFSYPNYLDLRERNNVFTSLMAHNMAMVGVAEGDRTRRVFADIVSSNYFQTLGVQPFRGRGFTAAEERPASGAAVAIISHSYWKRAGADPNILGKTIRINSRFFTVVGVAAEGFTGTTALISPEIYVPLGMYEAIVNDFEGHGRPLAARDNHCLILVGRLRPGVTEPTADRQLGPVASMLQQSYPAENKDQVFLVRHLSRLSVTDNPVDDSGVLVPASLLLCTSAVILLIASLNVANMMLARGTARRKEIALRLALGGDRRSIVRQLVTEGLVLSILGGIAGLVVAYWSTLVLVRSLARLAPIDLVYNAGPDLRVLVATLAFCVFSTLLFSLLPAWSLSQPNLASALKQAGHEDAPGGKRGRTFSRRNVLVIGQISLSLVLLTAAGLFVRSSSTTAQIQPGFQPEHGILIEVDASLAGYDEARGRQVYATLLERLKGVPGVQSASFAATVPFGMITLGRSIEVPGRPSGASKVSAGFNIVNGDYFRTLGIPLLRGRTFRDSEARRNGNTGVAVIDKVAAEQLWPGHEAVGNHIRLDHGDAKKAEDLEVVGVVASVQDHIFGGGSRSPHVWVPFGQEYQADTNIHLKLGAQMAPEKVMDAVRKEIYAVDQGLPILALQTLREHMEGSFDFWIVRTGARMFAIFGSVALLLATIGLYGVRAYSVATRTHEIGIRMALGAKPGDTLRMVLREGLLLTAIGLGIGLPLSMMLSKILATLLYGVTAFDAGVMSAAAMLLAMVSAFACYVPARRAAHVDPLVALRYE